MPWQFSENAKRVRKAVYDGFRADGRCGNIAELMKATGLSAAQVHEALGELERGTILVQEKHSHGSIVKAMPWASFPTHHIIHVEGHPKTYIGCALEIVNVAECYPGKTVAVNSSCPHCGDSVTLKLKDDQLLGFAPQETVIHIGVSPIQWWDDWVVACASTNFFPSITHVREWEKAHPDLRGAVITIPAAKGKFKVSNRLDYDKEASDTGGQPLLQWLKDIGAAPSHW